MLISKRKKTRAVIHTTALIDIVFLLLIYFLLTSSFIEQENLSIKLPKVVKSASSTEQSVVINIDKAGHFYVNNNRIQDKQLGPLLQDYMGQYSDRSVVIRADRQVVYHRIVKALDIARQNGAKRLNLAVEKKL